ncbi:long-chain acyl-CoA synthetase [Fonticula alba]|uniref:Long-chain acyl-CoA synthetase n=1 Tax=Fonticula alba TaxID=691883 RepID=A0A058ZA28_FONAL|nr:long-chain acyl-CoA synthetase [Fonticula alba]KCV71154.1 long-chain acyl-CoA synthetase [Fonticula alba]|eukprot:XP_009494277.1 long-chain acyl-CoA synthetase [Fonticula alba]
MSPGCSGRPGRAEGRADIIDGYIYSGDIGLWDERGRLRIIDRKKNIFKLAQGEYIAPEKIEIVYGKAKYVAQVFVHGDSLKAFLVGIVIPDEETLMPWAKEQPHLAGKSFEEVCNDPAAVDLVLKDMVKTGKELDLKGFEQVKKIHLTPVQFSVENDCMTPTFKLKRPQCKSFHQEVIDKMIAEVEAAEQAK